MIPLTATPSPVSMSAGVKSSTYSIALTGKTFDVLSSMLYKDPHLAIVRELSCNALDSHVVHGNIDQPFDIHLPNTIEPYFAIRDYGTGMSAEQIDSVYTKFFESTKTTSNDVVGALGLGSKSPFSYTSNYTITSWHNGLKLVYSAFKSTDGIPSIALLDVSDTTEPTGLEVQFAVKSTDFTKFTEKVQSFFTTWSSVPPNIIGGMQGRVTLKQVERDFGGEGWFIAKSGGPLYSALAIQGNVPYPLQRATITGSNEFRERFANDESTRHLIHRLLELPIIIQFPIGSLDFSASREELQYTELTVAAILDKLVQIGKDIRKHILAQAETKATQWDIIEYCRALRSDRLSNVIRLIGAEKLNWKGKQFSISTTAVQPDIAQMTAALALHPLQFQVNHRRKMDSVPLWVSKIEKDATTGEIKATEVINTEASVSPGAGQVNIVVFNEAKGNAAKLKYHFLDKIQYTTHGDVFSISVPRGEKIVDQAQFAKAVNGLLAAFDVVGSKVNVVWTDKLSAPPSKHRKTSAAKVDDTFKVLRPSLTGDRCQDKFASYDWSTISAEDLATHITTGKYTVVYVPIVRGVPVHLSPKLKEPHYAYNEEFAELWNNLTQAVKPKRVLLVGIKSSALENKKVVTMLQSMQSLENYLRFWLYENAKATTISNAFHLEWINNHGNQKIVWKALATLDSTQYPVVSDALVLIKQFHCDKSVQPLMAATRELIQQVMRALRQCDRADGVVDSVLPEIDTVIQTAQTKARDEYVTLTRKIDTIMKKFPLLQYVDSAFRYSHNESDTKLACAQISEYIKLASTTNKKD